MDIFWNHTFWKNIIGIANVDCSSQAVTLFLRLPAQKDTLLKTLNSIPCIPCLILKSLKATPCSAAHTCIGQKGLPPPQKKKHAPLFSLELVSEQKHYDPITGIICVTPFFTADMCLEKI